MISLELQHLTRSYGHKPVFGDVNLLHQNGILGIAGSNGSGKSTLLKCMAGLLQPSSGQVRWKMDDTEISRDDLNSHMGYAAPYVSLYKELTVRENLGFLARLRKMPVSEEAMTELLNLVDLTQVQNQHFGLLSTGQQQRARLASSILHNPSALLLDEPGSNLDQEGRALIKQIATLYSDAQKLLIIASNNDQELALCDRVFSVEQETFI